MSTHPSEHMVTLACIFFALKTLRVPSAEPDNMNWSATFSKQVTVSVCSNTSEMRMPFGLVIFSSMAGCLT